MKISKVDKCNVDKPIVCLDNKHMIFIERLERCFALIEESSEWKMKYEYYQSSKYITQNSIIVSET